MGSTPRWDVAVVGAGLAGACAASVLGRKGIRVVLIDAREAFPACFRAEKIEPDQAELFRKFGLLEGLLPYTGRVREVLSARNAYVLRRRRVEQYGIFYQDMVNGVRRQLPPAVTWKIGRVQAIDPGADASSVILADGDRIDVRLVVLACGVGTRLLEGLGIRRRMISERHSLSLGFNVERVDGRPFTFDSLTYHPDGVETRDAFLSLFPIREVMRANYFVYRIPGEEWARRFVADPDGELRRHFPCISRFTPPFRVSSRVEMCPVDLYRAEGHVRPGLVLVGDAYQGPCPATGMGVSKVLTDVDVLGDCVPRWLSTPGMGIEKIERFYRDARKVSCDDTALRKALFRRALSTRDSNAWRVRRELRYLGIRLYGWARGSKSVVKLAG
jgi:2-polyprenyl-6-methoxyphenol hydroxylase-like FAD-dependent oxidoreductase